MLIKANRLIALHLALVAALIPLSSSASPQLSAAGPARAEAPARADDRPSVVPFDFVPTPFGYFHPSCVAEVRTDEKVRDGIIERIDGAKRKIPACAYPHYDRNGNAIFPWSSPPPHTATANSWIASANTFTPGPMSSISAEWTVPNNPTTIGNQIVYFFPGFEDANPTTRILQPVLGWNGAEGGGKK